MSSGRVMLTVPLFSSLNVILTMTSSAVLFGDFNSMPINSISGFAIGVTIVASGILLLPLVQYLAAQYSDAPSRGTSSATEGPWGACLTHAALQHVYLVQPKSTNQIDAM